MAEIFLLNEPFNYADGNLQTVAGSSVWKTYAVAFSAPSTTTVPVASAKIGGWVNATRGEAIYQPVLPLEATYSVRLAFTVHNVNASNEINIWVRANIAAPTNNAVVLTLAFGALNTSSNEEIGISTVNETNIATHTFASNMFVAGQSYVLELRVDGDTFTALLDGVPYCSGTSSNHSTDVGVGFGMSTSSTVSTPAELDDFIVSVPRPSAVRGLSSLLSR